MDTSKTRNVCMFLYIRKSYENPYRECLGYCCNVCHPCKRNRNEMGIKFAYSLKHRGAICEELMGISCRKILSDYLRKKHPQGDNLKIS